MRVVEEPFTSQRAIVGIARLDRPPTPRAFRTLRAKRLVSPGLYVQPHGPRGEGPGRTAFHSSLNADAARAVRLGREDIARSLAERAEELEHSDDSQAIRKALQDVVDRRAAAPAELVLTSHHGSPRTSLAVPSRATQVDASGLLIRSGSWLDDDNRDELIAAIINLDAAAAQARFEILGSSDTSATTFFGTVRRLDTVEAEIESRDEARRIGRDALDRAGLSTIGTPVALFAEQLANGGTFQLPMPAVALDDPAVEEQPSPWDLRPLSFGELRFQQVGRRDLDWIVSTKRRTSIPAIPLREA